MDAAKVEIALRRYVCNVCGDPPLLAKLPYACRCFGVVDRSQNHVRSIEVVGLEFAIDMLHLLLFNSVCYFLVQTFPRGDDRDFCIGIENVEDATCCHLQLNELAFKIYLRYG